MASHLKKVCPLSRTGNQDSAQQVSGVRCNIFGKGERSGNYILIKQVNVVSFRVRGVIIKWQVARQHGIL
jgi:hypothetical protein